MALSLLEGELRTGRVAQGRGVGAQDGIWVHGQLMPLSEERHPCDSKSHRSKMKLRLFEETHSNTKIILEKNQRSS